MGRRSVYYGAFGGIDRDSKNASFAAAAENFAVDRGGSLYKFPGRETFADAGAQIDAYWAGSLGGRKAIVYLCGGNICDTNPDNMTTLLHSASGAARAAFFKFEGALYALCDTGYFKYDGTSLTAVSGYVPLIAVSTAPDGAGTPYESVNMLTAARRQQFSPDGAEATFRLAEAGIASVDGVTLDGTALEETDYSADTAAGTVTLNAIPAAGVNTLEIEYSASSSGMSEFLGYKNAMLFGSNADERVFLWHNDSKPCFRIHSELADGVPSAEYFPVDSYTSVGSSPITDIVQEYDKQLIFTSDAAYYSYCEMKTFPDGRAYASFPVYPLHPAKGNLIYGCGCTVDGMPVTLCKDGVNFWQPTSVETEKNAVCVSAAVSDLILPETYGLSASAKLFDLTSANTLMMICANSLLAYDYRAKRWSKLALSGISGIFDAFGTTYTVEGTKLCRLTSTVRAGDAFYRTPYSDLGSCSLKDILYVRLTVEGGYLTAGSVKVIWPGESANYSEEKSFSVPATHSGDTVTLVLPFFIPSVRGISVEIKCPSGKDLKVLGYGVIYDDKGESYGL